MGFNSTAKNSGTGPPVSASPTVRRSPACPPPCCRAAVVQNLAGNAGLVGCAWPGAFVRKFTPCFCQTLSADPART